MAIIVSYSVVVRTLTHFSTPDVHLAVVVRCGGVSDGVPRCFQVNVDEDHIHCHGRAL